MFGFRPVDKRIALKSGDGSLPSFALMHRTHKRGEEDGPAADSSWEFSLFTFLCCMLITIKLGGLKAGKWPAKGIHKCTRY